MTTGGDRHLGDGPGRARHFSRAVEVIDVPGSAIVVTFNARCPRLSHCLEGGRGIPARSLHHDERGGKLAVRLDRGHLNWAPASWPWFSSR